jgi:hypothetical protein
LIIFLNLWENNKQNGRTIKTKKGIEIYKGDNEKEYVVIVNEAGSGQNQLFEKVIIDSQNLVEKFEVRAISQEYR